MDHHVADIERLRVHLGVDRWIVVGISWGSVLGATYAERHPDRVTPLVLVAVSTGTPLTSIGSPFKSVASSRVMA